MGACTPSNCWRLQEWCSQVLAAPIKEILVDARDGHCLSIPVLCMLIDLLKPSSLRLHDIGLSLDCDPSMGELSYLIDQHVIHLEMMGVQSPEQDTSSTPINDQWLFFCRCLSGLRSCRLERCPHLFACSGLSALSDSTNIKCIDVEPPLFRDENAAARIVGL